MLCTLNTTSQIKSKQLPMDSKTIFSRMHSLNSTFGLNATSISEITKVPRTTVLRKISCLEKFSQLDQTESEIKNRLEQLRALDNNINIDVILAKNKVLGVDTMEDYMELKKIMEYKS